MELIEQLSDDGWKLSTDGYNTVTDEGKITDKESIKRKALDIDLRELGGCAFPQDFNKGKYESITGNMVVQLQKVKNISAPKANEESKHAPRMFKLIITDGTQSCSALEMSPIDDISFNTPPGTKIRLKGEMVISHGLLLLHTENVEVLGGRVTALFDKWITNKNLAKQARGRVGAEGGPPPWIPFGEKLAPSIADRNFKSLDDGSKESKDNEEFEAQRRDAIAEARAAGCTKKIFGGGTKPFLDRNIQAITSKGFTFQEAEAALKQSRNNVDRALKSLQRKTGKGGEEKEKVEKEQPPRERGGRRKGGDEDSGPKPSGKVSLFQFLEDKLPSLPEKDKTKEKEKEWEPPKQEPVSKPKGYPGQEKSIKNRDRGNQNNVIGNGIEKKTREERQPRWQQTQREYQNKPPRFQNQNKKLDINNDPFEHFMNRIESQGNRQNENNYFGNKNSSNQFNGFRNNYKMDSLGYNMNSGNDYRNQNSNFFKPSGMPEIPEFPYKDSAFIPPLMPSSMHSMNGNKGGSIHNSPHQKTENGGKYKWKVGDKCMAKYWENNSYYNAEITGVSKKTCVVRFLDYGNFEEVWQDDCIPISEEPLENINLHGNDISSFNNNKSNHFSGSIEFRRGGTRPYIKPEANSGGRKPRYSQPVYVPPASRRDAK